MSVSVVKVLVAYGLCWVVVTALFYYVLTSDPYKFKKLIKKWRKRWKSVKIKRKSS